MRNGKKKIVAVMMILIMTVLVIPFGEFTAVHAASVYRSASSVKGSSYAPTPALAEKLDKVFAGNIGLYKNAGCTQSYQAALGVTGLTGSNRYYIKSNTSGSVTYGWQCYIYANAVYNTLYNEWVGRASGLAHSNVVLTGGSTISYDRFSKAGVKCGAYVRTTANSDGSYHSSLGHSFIVLSYNASNITYIEGNADGHGLVRMVTSTWNELNNAQFSGRGRRLCHVVQPTDSYYNSLYGTSSGSSAAVTATPTPSAQSGKTSYSRVLSYNKSSVMSGNDVKYIQNCLKSLGYTVTVNSKYDSTTLAAVKKFQSDYSLTTDGKVGSKTWSAIEKAVASGGTLTITSQPSNITVSEGGKAVFTVKASGIGLSYQWYYKKKGASSWSKWSGHTTASTTATASESWNGMQVYCAVKNSSGKTVNSNTVKVTVTARPAITSQPKSVTVKAGKSVSFSVKATGSNLSYQWYYKKAGASSWSKWNGHTAASTTATASESWNGMQLLCKVTDGSGSTVSSAAATVTVG